MCFQGQRGHTLIELLTAVTILAILTVGALSSWNNLTIKSRQTAQLYSLLRALNLARLSAINQNTTITLCGSPDGNTCARDCKSPIVLIFADVNKNHKFDEGDSLIHRLQLPLTTWHWQGSAQREYLRFRNDGSAVEWGQFTLCSDAPSHSGEQIVLNMAGRAYTKTTQPEQPEAEQLCL